MALPSPKISISQNVLPYIRSIPPLLILRIQAVRNVAELIKRQSVGIRYEPLKGGLKGGMEEYTLL